MKKQLLLLTCSIAALALQAQRQPRVGDPKLTEQWIPEPKVISAGKTAADAPSDAIVLFNGTDGSAWEAKNGGAIQWKIAEGAMTVTPGTGEIRTKQSFGDCQLHIEWRTPSVVKGEGQGRGNCGIFFMSRYELQVLDSYNNRTYSNGQAGSIYKQFPPKVNASRAPGEWQTYDVIFTAPVFYEDGSLKSQAKITVLHNGVLIQHNTALLGSTQYIGVGNYEAHGAKEPIMLQDHGDLVSFRNIWIRPL